MNKLFFIFSVSILVSCGGGGGSGSSSASGGSKGIRIIHGALNGSPVDLLSNLKTDGIVTRSSFAADDLKGFASLPNGDQIVNLTRAKTPTAVVSANSVSNIDSRFSLLLFGNNGSLGIRTNLIDDSVPERDSSKALVKIIHALNGAASISSDIGGNTVPSLAFGTASQYLEVVPGALNVTIKRSTDQLLVLSETRQVQSGDIISILITGEVGYLVISKDYIG